MKEQIGLNGSGVMILSGEQITFWDLDDLELQLLPYGREEIEKAENPKNFMRFMNSLFPDPDTLESALYYLSLILAQNTEFRYGAFFIGGPMTGKTALAEILKNVLPDFIVHLPPETIMQQKKILRPETAIASLCGKGAGIIQEFPASKAIDSCRYKILTGGDTIWARRPYEQPFSFIPTAQIIVISNQFPYFDYLDMALEKRLLIFPFMVPHDRGKAGTMLLSEIIENLRPEFPGIVKLLGTYYVRLKTELKGIIPQSAEMLDMKSVYYTKRESDIYSCEYCKEEFNRPEIIVENNRPRCPHCGSLMITGPKPIRSRKGE
jgi:phage/plasmid-associated DNA primase